MQNITHEQAVAQLKNDRIDADRVPVKTTIEFKCCSFSPKPYYFFFFRESASSWRTWTSLFPIYGTTALPVVPATDAPSI